MTLSAPLCVASVPWRLAAVQAYSPASFLVTLEMRRVPLSNDWWRRSSGSGFESVKEECTGMIKAKARKYGDKCCEILLQIDRVPHYLNFAAAKQSLGMIDFYYFMCNLGVS